MPVKSSAPKTVAIVLFSALALIVLTVGVQWAIQSWTSDRSNTDTTLDITSASNGTDATETGRNTSPVHRNDLTKKVEGDQSSSTDSGYTIADLQNPKPENVNLDNNHSDLLDETSPTSGTLAQGSNGNSPADLNGVDPTPEPNGSTVTGRITKTNGDTVSGVRVMLFLSTGGETQLEYSGLSDEEGVYTLRGITEGTGTLRVYSNIPGAYPPPPKKMMIGRNKEYRNQNIILDPGATIEGRVVDTNGDPISEVVLSGQLGNYEPGSVTRSDGTFAINGIPPNGTLTILTAVHPDYQPETRTSVCVLDGFQVITMKRTNGIILEVKWKLDGTPVTLYAYRLWKKHFTGLEVLGNHEANRVENEAGTTQLKGITSGDWKVEVTIINPEDGTATDIRNGQFFSLDQGVENMVVTVLIDGGATIKGTVKTNEGEAVSQAKIEFVPPSKGFGRFPPQVEPFIFPTAYSDSGGYFEINGMPPGHYTLTASKESLISTEAIDLFVPYDREPEQLDIILSSGGRIFGKFQDEDNNGIPGAGMTISIQRPNADGWINQHTETDQDGNYEFNHLPAGSHGLFCRYENVLYGDIVVNLEANEQKEQNFSIDPKIHITGTVRVNGQIPMDLGISHIRMTSSEGLRGPWVLVEGPTGGFQTEVMPGEWKVIAFGQNFQTIGDGELYTFPSTPPEQTHHFNLNYVPVEVVVIYPQDDQFVEGNLVLCSRDRARRYGFHRSNLHSALTTLPNVQSGQYQATFTTRDNQWHGATEWVKVGQGLENTLTLEVKKTLDGVKIGQWNPGELGMNEWTPLLYDVTHLLESEGDIEIVLNYESGRHAVETGKVSLLENGVPISVDDHQGWSGADRWNHIYRLNLNQRNQDAVYHIEANLRGDGGNDTKGSIYLSLN